MILHFVCPDPDEFVSGGNLYNRRLMAHLRQRQWTVIRSSWSSMKERPSSRGAAFYFYDSINFKALLGRQLPRPAAMIYHYLPGMEQVAGKKASTVPVAWKQLPAIFDLHLAPSILIRNLLVEQVGIDPQRVLVLSPLFEPLPLPAPATSAPPLLLMVANLLPVKGVLPFLAALQQLLDSRQKPPAFELRIVGEPLDPAYAAAVTEKISGHPEMAARVRLLDPVPQAELLRWYQRSDLVVSAARFESFGMAVFEALSVGVPVLALARGNVPNLITDQVNGLLFNNLRALMEALLHLLEAPEKRRLLQMGAIRHRPDPAARAQIGLDRLESTLHRYALS